MPCRPTRRRRRATTPTGILVYTEDEIVSPDIVTDPASCTFHAGPPKVLGGNPVKVVGRYDNEWGYSNRLVDLTNYIGRNVK